MNILPEELVVEILARLPAKLVRRCNCVSKPWRAIIASHPFQAAYQRRHGFLMVCWSDEVHFINSGVSPGFKRRFNFSYSTLSRRLEDSIQDFTPLLNPPVHDFYARATQLVNGLVCVGDTKGPQMMSRLHGLTLYNVCTGESMRIPEPEQYPKTGSTLHLGYDHASRRYKLLRLVFFVKCKSPAKLVDCQVMTLQCPGSVSTWRKIETSGYVSDMQSSDEARTYPRDGVLCWLFLRLGGLVLFDLDEERFRWFKLPEDIKDGKQQLVPRAQFNRKRLSLSVYVFPTEGDMHQPLRFMMEDDVGNRWSKQCVELPEEFERGTLGLAVSNGEMMMMMNPSNQENYSESRAVYCNGGEENKKVEKFWVGKLPHKCPALGDTRCFGWAAYFNRAKPWLSCLLDTNHLYLPLHDVLSCRGICIQQGSTECSS